MDKQSRKRLETPFERKRRKIHEMPASGETCILLKIMMTRYLLKREYEIKSLSRLEKLQLIENGCEIKGPKNTNTHLRLILFSPHVFPTILNPR